MEYIIVTRALSHSVPPSADNLFEVGKQVLVCREKKVERRIGEWVGTFYVQY